VRRNVPCWALALLLMACVACSRSGSEALDTTASASTTLARRSSTTSTTAEPSPPDTPPPVEQPVEFPQAQPAPQAPPPAPAPDIASPPQRNVWCPSGSVAWAFTATLKDKSYGPDLPWWMLDIRGTVRNDSNAPISVGPVSVAVTGSGIPGYEAATPADSDTLAPGASTSFSGFAEGPQPPQAVGVIAIPSWEDLEQMAFCSPPGQSGQIAR
jgi:hypothetical protein